MPTTPNPTPPVSDPATGAPTVPVYNTTKPDMLGMFVSATKSQIGYTDHNYDTNTYRSPYYDVPVIVSVPGTVFLDGVCPGRWSRRYYTASDAASLSGGSGYFGYDTNDQNYWWSTNFIDDGDAACSMVKSGGQYYSKNTTIASTHVLMGAVTVDGTNVNLKWGSTWGLVTRNAVFDYLDSTTTYVSRSTTIPRNADGTVDVTALNLSVMKYAPIRGCLVMFDMSSNIVLYTMMDGEQKQFAGSKLGSVAPALALRTATDPNSLPLTSKMAGLPTFVRSSPFNNTVITGLGNASWQTDTTTLGDKSRVWMKTFDSCWTGNADAQGGFSTQGPAQNASSAGPVLVNGTPTWLAFPVGTPLRDDPGASTACYTAWSRPGTSYQMVGWVSAGTNLVTSAYGVTSVAPSASIQGQGSYLVSAPNVQADILSKMPSSTGLNMGFMYDASIGDYGKVVWLSQP